MRRRFAIPFFAAAAALSLLVWQRGALFSQSRDPGPAAVDDSTVSLLVRFGVADTEALPWDGSLSIANGEVLALRNWHPRPADRIVGKSEWRLATLKGPNFVRRPIEEEQIEPPEPYLLQAGLIVDVKATATTRIDFGTKQGAFQVTPAEIRAGASASFLGGRVVVDRVAAARMLSSQDHQGDFATMLSGSNGEVWLSWVAYRDKANQVLARRYDGRNWGPVQTVTEAPSDVFLVKMGRDGKGRPWAVWSAQVNGNWDLYGRRFDGAAWSAVQRLTEDAGPDVFPNLATDSSGNLWLAWQGFRNGQSDIFARRYDGSSWSEPELVATSRANEWEPAIAADRIGNVYVAWDTYEKGNYDIRMRKFGNGKWSEPIPVAETLKFEAHASLACDRENRLWAAWNESGFQWGKDVGFLLTRQATALYRSRWMAVAVYTGARWEEPVADIEKSLPAQMQGYNDLPVLQADAGGRVWAFFRHRVQRFADTPSTSIAHRAAWEIWGVAYEGGRWSEPLFLPFSQGRTDARGGFASDGQGRMYAAWSTDNRDFDQFLFQRSDVYAGALPRISRPAAEPKLKPRTTPKLNTWSTHADEAADLARIRGYAVQSGSATYRIYRGDTHRHTEFSFDGHNDGSLLDGYRYALDAASLDFLGISDHNNLSGPDLEYVNWLEQQAADVFMLRGAFVPLCAYERAVSYPNGHRNVLFAVRGNPTLPTPREEATGKTGARSLYDYLRRLKAIAIPHTSAGNMGTDWRDNGQEVEPLVEIYQGDRVSAEYEGAPKAAYEGNPTMQPGGFRPLGYVWNAWEKGYKLGVQASSDHISTHISYACTLAQDFSRQGLIDAMQKRHSYGATDNIILDYRLQTGNVEYIQGDIGEAAGPVRLVVKAIGTRPIRQIDIIKNNTFVHTRQPMAKDVSFTFADNVPAGPKESYYYVRLIQIDDQMAWSSPIWIRRN
ncbi:MAG: hypothetical protein Q8N47_22550 [Bryobacterales bacterium]|nr:hypothetical protein [Bryobacterales bacterium]